jgi:hypothetical protein
MRRAAPLPLLVALMWVPGAALAQRDQPEDDDPLAIPPDDEEEPEFTIVDDDEDTRPAKPSASESDDTEPEAEPEAASPSSENGGAHGFGVGAIAVLGAFDLGGVHFARGMAGPAVAYDPASFHVEALVSFATGAGDLTSLAGRFWYHLHRSPRADFSVGGGIGYASVGDDEDFTVVAIEGGGEVRFFLVENVSVSAALGLRVLAGDASGNELLGNLGGSSGIVYYF